jgi:galactose mutarotase-like enzyme
MSSQSDFDGATAYVLRADDGTEAWVVPSIGANCVDLRVPLPGGAWAHLLDTPPSAEALRGHGTGWGFPILSPHPGRNRSPFLWRGQSYDPGNGRGSLPGHGFAARVAWEVVDSSGTALVSRLDTRRLGAEAAYWPWPFTLTVTHRVQPGTLSLDFELENLAEGPMPLLFGLHPYFPYRFIKENEGGGNAPDLRRTCRVWVVSGELLELDRGAATGTTRAAEGWQDLRRPRSLAEMEDASGVAGTGARLPLLYYGDQAALAGALAGDDAAAPGGVASGVDDAAAGLRLTLETSRAFGTVAAYFPDKPAVSMEPRTALPDALTLAASDPAAPTGLRAVEPRRPWHAWARLSASALP